MSVKAALGPPPKKRRRRAASPDPRSNRVLRSPQEPKDPQTDTPPLLGAWTRFRCRSVHARRRQGAEVSARREALLLPARSDNGRAMPGGPRRVLVPREATLCPRTSLTAHPKRRPDSSAGVHQASTAAHTPGDTRHTPRPPDWPISRRFLRWRGRAAPPLAPRTRLIIVRSLVRIQAELLGVKAEFGLVTLVDAVTWKPSGRIRPRHPADVDGPPSDEDRKSSQRCRARGRSAGNPSSTRRLGVRSGGNAG